MTQTFIPITLVSLKDCFKDLPLDIYLKLTDEKYVKAFERTTGLDFARLAHYEAKGVTHFYIDEIDKSRLDQFFSRSPMMTLANENSPVEEKRKAIWAVMEQTLFESFGLGITSQLGINKTFEALRTSLEQDGEFLKVLSLLLQIAPKSDLFFRHALSTCTYSYIVAVLAGQTSLRTLKILLFSALFHDIGKTKLPEGRRIASQNRTVTELQEFRMHPALTVGMFQDPLPFADEEVRRTILQHKERLDGKGYPYELRGVAIYSLAKILSIADGFSELTLGMEDGNCYTQAQAIATMRSDTGHYDNKLLLPFAQLILSRDIAKAA